MNKDRMVKTLMDKGVSEDRAWELADNVERESVAQTDAQTDSQPTGPLQTPAPDTDTEEAPEPVEPVYAEVFTAKGKVGNQDKQHEGFTTYGGALGFAQDNGWNYISVDKQFVIMGYGEVDGEEEDRIDPVVAKDPNQCPHLNDGWCCMLDMGHEGNHEYSDDRNLVEDKNGPEEE